MQAVLRVSWEKTSLRNIVTHERYSDNPLAGASPKNPVQEIMVQGPQIKHVQTLLVNKGVPKRLIAIDDKTAKKGKGRK